MQPESALVVTRNFPPLTGGMERLMHRTVGELAERLDLTVIGPRGCSRYCPDGVRAIECPVNPVGFLLAALIKGLLHAVVSRHRLVLGGSGLVAPVTAILSKVCGSTAAIFVHGLDLVVQNRIYQNVFIPSIRRHDIIIANSRNTLEIALGKKCEADRLNVIHPGTDIPLPQSLENNETTRKHFELGDGRILLFVGRIVRRKGLSAFMRNAWPEIVRSCPDVTLVIVGDTPDNALLRDPDEATEVNATMRQASQGSVRVLGPVDDALLWQLYAAADALVFPLVEVEGDVEGFGMVAVEAAACGTPTVAFRVGGVADAIADGVSGHLVSPKNYDEFADAAIRLLGAERPSADSCRAHAEQFCWRNHQAQLFSILLPDPTDLAAGS